MKKLALIAIALFTLHGMAQSKHNIEKRQELRRDMTPQDIASLKSKQMTLKLDLSDAQQRQVYNLILAQAEEGQKLRKAHLAKKEKGLKPTKDELVAFRNQKLDRQIEMKRKMKAILSAEQYAKLEKMKLERKGKKGRYQKKRNQK